MIWVGASHLFRLTLSNSSIEYVRVYFLDLKTARKLLGEDAIIGVTVASIEQAMIACEDGADYLGLGTIFATPTYASSLLPHCLLPSSIPFHPLFLICLQ